MIKEADKAPSISRQCDLLGVPRSMYYYKPIPESDYNLWLMQELDKLYLDNPAWGSRLMSAHLSRKGFLVNRKRIARLMKIMGIEAMYPKPKVRTTQPGYTKFPYLLANLEINAKNQVWGTDITYIPVNKGYMYMVAFLDLHSRFILSWNLSNSLESEFCLEALKMALKYGQPGIINSDQGVQYTSHAYIDLVKSQGASISMSGKGRCWDNIFVERLWRSLKYEEVYLKQYCDPMEAHENIGTYVEVYNRQRPHSSLNYQTPAEVYLRI